MLIVVEILLAVVLLGILVGAFELGFRVGRRRETTAEAGSLGTVQGAILGLLALLLGFSYSGAASRFLDRQLLIVQEANAIGTAALRADLLEEPHRTRLKERLRDYSLARVEMHGEFDSPPDSPLRRKVEQLQQELFTAAADGIRSTPVLGGPVLNPVNELIDLHTTRLAAQRRHLPLPIFALLILCAAVSLAGVGYGNGPLGRREPLSYGLVFLVAATLWITFDLDFPRIGLIRIDQTPLVDAISGLPESPKAPRTVP